MASRHPRPRGSPAVPGPQITTPQQVGSLLGRVQREAARAAGVGPVDRETWRQVVGDRIANRTMADRLQGEVLEVRVASSVWAQELSLLSADIIARLRQRRIRVRRIRFHVGTIPELDSAEPMDPPPHPVQLPESLQTRLSALDDPELAAAIAEAASYSLARSPRQK
jgi:hypothetical protein